MREGHHSFMIVYSQWIKVLLESAKGRYFVPRVCPKSSLTIIAAVCFQQVPRPHASHTRGLCLKKTLAALDPMG